MELDVRLVRYGDGFRIVNDEADSLCAERSYEMTSGLYDPVLDDSDVILEPLDQEQEDFDQPSRLTEVLPDFIDSLDLLNGLPEFLDSKSESRSLTASPFVLQTKPYRPFSTTPLPEIPPVEEPIILNPEYQDVFDQLGIDEDFLPKTRFKLPISEQYDPDGTKRKDKGLDSGVTLQEIKDETTQEIKKETSTDMRQEHVTREESNITKECMKETILEQIEQTATNVIKESIEKSVVVAEETQKEIDVTMNESVIICDSKQMVDSKQVNKEVAESVKQLDQLSEEINQNVSKIDVKVVKEKFEAFDKKEEEQINERKSSAKQEIEETIQVGTVKSKTSTFDKVSDIKISETKDAKKKSSEQNKTKDAKSNQKEVKENITKKKSSQSSSKSSTKTKTNTKASQERAYVIGLQTIPNIRGTIHSNYHYDMLLKTFFVHLTDVMVALSRFILTDPAHFKIPEDLGKSPEQDKEEEEDGEEEEKECYSESVTVTQEEKISTDTKASEELLETQQQKTMTALDSQLVKETLEKQIENQQLNQENVFAMTEEEVQEKRHLSGSQMAQMTEKKSEELIQNLGAVINEFQTKTGLDETEIEGLNVVSESRNRSRSKTKEIIKDVEPSVLASTVVEAASKVSNTQAITEITTTSERFTNVESRDVKTLESKFESKEVEDVESKDAKTYIAIVEAHVYTNKDAITQEQLTEFSKTSSVQSAEETNIALVSNEAVSTEKVALKDLEVNKVIAKSAVEQAHDLAVAKSHETIQVSEQTETINKVEENKVFLDKTSLKVDSGNSTERNQESVQERLVKPVQKARIIKGILKVAKDEIKGDAFKEVNKVKEGKSVTALSEIKGEELIIQSQKTETLVTEEKGQNIQKESAVISQATEESTVQKSRLETVQVEELKSAVSLSTEKIEQVSTTASVESKSISSCDKKEVFIAEEKIKNEVESDFESKAMKDESAALKITKEKVTEMQQVTKQIEDLRNIHQITETSSIKSFEGQKLQESVVESFESHTVDQECTFIAKSVDQESSFTAKLVECEKTDQESTLSTKTLEQEVKKDRKKLTLSTKFVPLKKIESQTSVSSEIDTPTPATIPPTPLTDEYIFKLQIPLPPEPLVPVPRDCTPSDSDDEDPHIVKKNLVPHIETKIEESIVYDVPLQSPPGTPGSPTKATPVYTKPGLKGGGVRRQVQKEEILELERKSSLLTSAIDQTIKSIEEYREEVGIQETNGTSYNSNENQDMKMSENMAFEAEKSVEVQSSQNAPNSVDVNDLRKDVLEGYRPVQFHPEELQNGRRALRSAMVSNGQILQNQKVRQPYTTDSGEIIGTNQGIVDGLDKAVVDDNVAKELGKPGMTEEKIAELISGESEMLREAHVMGLCRVLSTHMHRPGDDSSVDFKKIKPIVESLKDSEVLKALNDELMRTKEEKKKEERKWTTFMQKPQRPVPRAKFGYHGYTESEVKVEEPYKVKIVKQPKPKVAPDYKPEDFETGLLPWEERALREPTPPPVEPEDPILIPEDQPEILQAVDPLPESEVPDLEDSGIPLPPPETEEESQDNAEEEEGPVEIEELDLEAVLEETEKIVEENIVEEMESGNVAEQLMMSVQNMVDPNAPLDQQLAQMRAQLAALAQLPCVIQQSLEMVTRQLSQLTQLESQINSSTAENASEETKEDAPENQNREANQDQTEVKEQIEEVVVTEVDPLSEVKEVSPEELERMRREEEEMLEEQRRIEKQKKELMEQARIESESRQIKQRPTPRVGKPKPAFGPATPMERPLVLPGGRKWRKPQDAYNEQFIAETLAAQAEIIRGKAKGLSYESVLLPYDERINFMKYEKPPVSLDHLQESETYKLIHNMEAQPLRRVEALTTQICEADYREKCRSITPCTERMAKEEHLDFPQQVQP